MKINDKIILYENYTETDVDEAYLSEIRNKQIDNENHNSRKISNQDS